MINCSQALPTLPPVGNATLDECRRTEGVLLAYNCTEGRSATASYMNIIAEILLDP